MGLGFGTSSFMFPLWSEIISSAACQIGAIYLSLLIKHKETVFILDLSNSKNTWTLNVGIFFPGFTSLRRQKKCWVWVMACIITQNYNKNKRFFYKPFYLTKSIEKNENLFKNEKGIGYLWNSSKAKQKKLYSFGI